MISTDYVDLRLLRADSNESDTPKQVANKPEGYWDAILIQKSKEIEQDDALSDEDRARASYQAAFQQLSQYYACQQQASAAADALAAQEANVLSRLADSDETVATLTENKAAAQSTLLSHQTEKKRLENEKSSKLNANTIKQAGINSQIATSRGIIAVKESELTTLQNNLNSKQAESDSLATSITTNQASLDSITQQLAQAQSQTQFDEEGNAIPVDTSALEAQKAQLESTIASLKEQKAAKDAEILQLNTDKARVEAEKAAEESRLATYQQNLANAQQERENIFATYDPQIQSEEASITEAQANLDSVTQELDTNLQENYNIGLEAAEVQKQKAEATTFLTSINYMVTVQEAEVARLEEELQKAEDKSEEAKKSFEEAEADTKSLEEGAANAGESLRLVA